MSKVIALDAGHGLKTAGKQTPDGIKEWTLNDKVRDKVVALLSSYDVKFVFTDNDEGKTDESLASRRSTCITLQADAFVSIHHNAFTGKWGTATGVEVFTDKNPTAADMELARLIYANLPKYTGLKGRGLKKENWTVINQNSVPAVLVEGGFMDSKIDYPIITSDKGQEGYAKAIAEGLIEFLELEKKPATGKNFKVRLLEPMNVRKKPGVNGKFVTEAPISVYTIVKTKNVKGVPWGKLKSGLGWICIADAYCERV